MLPSSPSSSSSYHRLVAECSSIIYVLNTRLPLERHIHTDYTALVGICTHRLLPQLLMVLQRESMSLQIPNTIKSHILCLYIIVSKTYSFNPTTSPQHNDVMIYSCWQRIECVRYLEGTYGMSSHLSRQLLLGRTCNGCKSIADARGCDCVVSMTKTPKTILLQRDRILNLAHGSQMDITIECDSPMTKFMSIRVYRSIYQCMVSGSNIGDIWVRSITPKECNDTKVPFMYPDCHTIGHMSPQLGMESPCNILMRTGDSWSELHDEQSVDPLVYIYNSG
jgi:hypothetical protein